MYRERLRSKRGCVRCRERKKKCDEVRPTCSFCNRWQLRCKWPTQDDSSAPRATAPRQLPQSTSVVQQHDQFTLCRPPHTANASFDPFCAAPLFERDQSEIVDHLKQFFTMFARLNHPLEDVGARNGLAQHWFEAALYETAVCHATLSCFTKIRAQFSNHMGLRHLGIKLEIQTLSSLRRQIESGSATEHVLLAAAIHFVSAALDVQDGHSLRRMLYGIQALVNSCGGIDHIVTNMAACTVFCVQHTDIFNSMVNADQYLFVMMETPPRPLSFSSVHNPRPAWSAASSDDTGISEEVWDSMELVEFLMCFRLPSRETRKLSRDEFGYLCSLEYWLNYHLGLLQHKYSRTSHIDTVAITATLIVKLEVFAEASSHDVLILCILNRLKKSIQSLDLTMKTLQESITTVEVLTLWAAVVTLVGRSLVAKRAWFLDYIRTMFVRRYGDIRANWPADIEHELRERLQRFPWHPRIDTCLTAVYSELSKG